MIVEIHIITWVISCLALLVSLWNAYESRPSISVSIANTRYDDTHIIRKNQILINILNSSKKICKITNINVQTIPSNKSICKLNLVFVRDCLLNDLNNSGYEIRQSYDIPPDGEINTAFHSSRIVTEGTSQHVETDSLNDSFSTVFKIDISYRYFLLPITMSFIFEKHKSSEKAVWVYRLISSKEKICLSYS